MSSEEENKVKKEIPKKEIPWEPKKSVMIVAKESVDKDRKVTHDNEGQKK